MSDRLEAPLKACIAFEDDLVTLYHGDNREIMPQLPAADLVLTDPPYGDTSLEWDKYPAGWAQLLNAPQAWVFGSMRMWIDHGRTEFADWKLAQDVVWEKHNGSSFHADRFRRVHEHAVHWYQGEWNGQYVDVQTTMDATPRAVRRKQRPAHTGHIEESTYVSEDGGPRLQRSVIAVRSMHGMAIHPTEKPIGILTPLILASCPEGGLIVDPFAGSASTLDAARRLGRRAIGIEANPKYIADAVRRLEQGVLVHAS